MTLYEEILATGGYIANHESDLYIEVNDTNREILKRHPLKNANKTTFTNQVTGKQCWDVPFAYDPWWSHHLDGAKNLAEMTLHTAISKRGWTSRKENDDQRRTLYDAEGNRLGSFDAAEAWAFLRDSAVHLTQLNQLQLVEADTEGPWALYIFDVEGAEGYLHGGKQWFVREVKYADEQITIPEAKARAEAAIAGGYEVRVCDGGDNLVFHAEAGGKILHGEGFWGTIAHV